MYVLAQLRIKFWLLSKHSGKWFLKNLVKNFTTKMIFIAATGFYWGGGGGGEESKVKLTTPEDLRLKYVRSNEQNSFTFKWFQYVEYYHANS